MKDLLRTISAALLSSLPVANAQAGEWDVGAAVAGEIRYFPPRASLS